MCYLYQISFQLVLLAKMERERLKFAAAIVVIDFVDKATRKRKWAASCIFYLNKQVL